MRALVVGGAGFIGSHLCRALLQSGHTVTCMDNFSLGTERNISDLTERAGFLLCRGDASEEAALRSVFVEAKPDYVFHLAANSDIRASAQNPEVEYQNTYSTTFQILNCMRRYGVKRMFFASTSAVYGDKRDILLDEHTPDLAPVSYYGAAKLGAEALIHAFSYMNDIRALVFRFPNVIGPGLTHGVIYDFIRKLEKDPKRLEILGDGRQTKPYIYIRDLIDAICQFMDGEEDGVTLYNVGVSGETSVTGIADVICREKGLFGVTYCYAGGEGGWKGDVPRFRYGLDNIHKAGWQARYTSDEAVEMTVRAALAERDA